MKTMVTTLLWIKKDGKILLARKKRGFGAGKINGVGGKLEPGETVTQAMIRETQEEIGVTPLEFEKMAIIEFDELVKGERAKVVMHIYLANDYEGEPTESEEMQPLWFDENNLPLDQMFEDDIYWKDNILSGKKCRGKIVFDDDFHITSVDIKIVDNLE